MPNHVTNIITFKNQKAFDLFKEMCVSAPSVEGGDEVFDFNKIIPMPKELGIECSSDLGDGIELILRDLRRSGLPGTKKTIEKVIDAMSKQVFPRYQGLSDEALDEIAERRKARGDYDKLIDLGKKAIQNILDYGCCSWYQWAVENWGTKWNSYNYRDNPDELLVFFQTAWSTPVPIIYELSEMIPNGIESVEFADEDVGHNCGYYDYKYHNCRVEYLEDGSDAAFDLAIRVQGDEDLYEKDEAGHWHLIDD